MDEHRSVEDTPASQRLTNEDFRKLLMTPRSTPSGAHPAGSIREAMANAGSMPPPAENKSELRRKKKSYYAALKKQEDTKLAELAEKYRDRARERRDGLQDVNPLDPTSNTSSAYRAVAPDAKSGMDAKERRRQMIQESKYLGGDMEHTHLVKGLDYALLQKVRSEIQTREQEQEAEMERLVTAPVEEVKEKKEVPVEEEMQFETPMAKNIYNMILEQKSKKVARNELFAAGRMAYVVELDEEGAIDSDIPTTLTRSKADVPEMDERSSASAANDVVVDKLAQIFSYLRHGRHRKLKKMKEKGGEKGRNDDSIYGDIGDYVAGDRRNDRREDRPRSSYFDKPVETEKEEGPGPVGRRPGTVEERDKRSAALLSRLAAEPEGYAECYPGLREMDDAIDDSDDEVDYSKMDAGNKKGPIGRWDFDTQEEYSAYMSSKEALPKAAFQYGVKTQDGRKTRKTKDKSEKAELDREWQQIQNIIQKRKAPKYTSEEPGFKTPRY
ncbi:unnamed protein product [Colias eurytheme]|nr:unnamed protein product [Colias eurytheme]